MRFMFVFTALFVLSCGYSKQDTNTGLTGPAGKDGTVVTVVQLCLGTTTYPNNFVEVAFCIDNKLYGTYSANGGFSTELAPGTYSSNAIGNSCTLIIQDNCVVTH